MQAAAAAWRSIAKKLMNEARKAMIRLHGARRALKRATTPKKSAMRYRAHEALEIAKKKVP